MDQETGWASANSSRRRWPQSESGAGASESSRPNEVREYTVFSGAYVVHFPVDQPVGLHLPQGLSQHLLGETRQPPAQLAGALRS